MRKERNKKRDVHINVQHLPPMERRKTGEEKYMSIRQLLEWKKEERDENIKVNDNDRIKKKRKKEKEEGADKMEKQDKAELRVAEGVEGGGSLFRAFLIPNKKLLSEINQEGDPPLGKERGALGVGTGPTPPPANPPPP